MEVGKTLPQQESKPVAASEHPEIHDRVLEAYLGKLGDQFKLDTQKRIHWVCSKVKGPRVLDVGCSQGIAPVLLGREGCQVTGIDVDPQAIAAADAFLASQSASVQKNVTFLNADFITYPFDREIYDTVILSEVLEHLVNPATFVELAAERLEAGGRLLVTVPFGINDWIDHKRTYYATEPLRLVWKRFSIDEVELLGKWIGFSCSKRQTEIQDELTDWPWSLIERVETAFYTIERSLHTKSATLSKQLDDSNKKNRAANEQVTKLKSQVDEFPQLKDTLVLKESQLKASEEALATIRDEVADNRVKLNEVNFEYRAASAQVALLQERIAQAETELAKARQDVQTEQAQRHAGEVELVKLQEKLTYQQTQAADLRAVLDETQRKNRNMVAQMASLQDRIAQAETELAKARQDVLVEQTQRQIGEAELAKLQEMLNHQQTQATDLHAVLAETQRKHQGVVAQMALLQERIAQAETELAKSRQEVQAEQAQRHAGEVELAKLQEKLTYQQAQATDLRTVLEETQRKHRDVVAQMALLQERIAQADAELVKSRQEFQAEQAQRHAGEVELAKLQEKLTHQQAQATDLRAVHDETQRKHQDVVAQMALLQERIAQAETELAKARQEVQAEQAQRHAGEVELAKLQEKLTHQQAQATELSAVLDETYSKQQDLTGQVALLKKQIAQDEADLDHARNELDNAQAQRIAGELELFRLQEQFRHQQALADAALQANERRITTLQEALERSRTEAEANKSQPAEEQVNLAGEIETLQRQLAAAHAEQAATQQQLAQAEKLAATTPELESLRQSLATTQAELQLAQAEQQAAQAVLQTAQAERIKVSSELEIAQALRRDEQQRFKLMTERPTLLERAVNAPAEAPTEVTSSPKKGKKGKQKGSQTIAVPAVSTAPVPLVQPTPTSFAASLKGHRVACIMDEFTYSSYRPECNLLRLTPQHWQDELEAFVPQLLFIESAWKGKDELWGGKISYNSNELVAIVEWCHTHQVPMVFWNKEDPVHFERFLHVARAVDVVFTTDIDCITRYKRDLGHDRVYLLPFAAQPLGHNPIELYPRKAAFNFAGSYYWRYPERQRDFKNILEVASEFRPVEIYDRNFDKPQPHDFLFPDEFQPYILGNLPFDQIDKAYKGYRYGINLNTIKYSQTMFARRVFELLASNTVVVSNFSRGVRLFFGDLVISSDAPAELRRRIATVCGDDLFYRKYRLAGLRKVMTEHTYAHRLAYLVSKVAGTPMQLPAPVVCMVGFPASSSEAEQLVETFERQNYPHRRLCLVGTGYSRFAVANRIHCVNSADAIPAIGVSASFMAPLSAHDYYGPNYLTDLTLATAYSDAPVIGKVAAYEQRGEALSLTSEGQQYRYVTEMPARSALIDRELFAGLNIRSAQDIAECLVTHPQALSTDEFNYCRDCGSMPGTDILRLVNDLEGMDIGLSWMGELAPLAEKVMAAPAGSISDAAGKLPGLDTSEWFALLPSKIPKELEFKPAGDAIAVTFGQPADKYQYVYLTKHFPREAFQIEKNDRFQIKGTADGDVRLVFVFLNDKGEKISHKMANVGRSFTLEIPSACAAIRMGLRLQGSGTALLGCLLTFNSKPSSVMVPQSKCLVLTNQYPAYDDLYRFAFLHSRVRAYKEQGHKVDVFRLNNTDEIEYREFEGIDVLSANHAFLDTVLSQGTYTHVLIHILDRAMQNVLDRHIDHIKEIVWVHGAEIQPWYRRPSNFTTAATIKEARRYSDLRLAMWRELLSRHHSNLHLVFVSQYQAREAMSDLGIDIADDRYDIIPNFVNGEMFAYHPKSAEQRKRILSIRPYASAVYGNDLMVAAIQLLAKEPYFDQLEFKIVGDGILFEEILAPLQGMSNVVIERRFLTQQEIATLHREYGVFLVPSRMDSQGVSRDEAMASGLVPVTNRVTAIPEFVNEDCAFLAAPEDAEGLADAIRCLYHDPDLFLRMSDAAARHVRTISSFPQTIGRELELLSPTPQPVTPGMKTLKKKAPLMCVAIYGDVNLNITDGSAIWAVSLAETIAGIEGVHVTLYLKARVRSTQIIAPLLNLSNKLRLVEPMPEDGVALTPLEALEQISEDDRRQPYHAIILRGLDLCTAASQRENIRGRIWAYITDLPQRPEDISTEIAEGLTTIIDASAYMLCQTRQFEAHLLACFPTAAGKTRLLPPMIPMCDESKGSQLRQPGAPFRLVYAGKFAPLWGIREMFHAFELLHQTHPEAEFHIYGDKIHNPADDPAFREEVQKRLEGGNGIVWHRAVPRETLMRELHNNDVSWAFRHAALEAHTHELSTKVLEYAAYGVPVILARNEINEDVFGRDYPLFADCLDDATDLLRRMAEDSAFQAGAVARMMEVSQNFTFESVRENLRSQGLFSQEWIEKQ